MLDALLGHIDRIYGLGLDVHIEEFLIDRELCRKLSGEVMESTVLVQQSAEGGEIRLGVYLGEHILSRLDGLDLSKLHVTEELGLLCTAIEEVSHFAYLCWNAHHGKQVTRLELELQGEVDKFITSVLMVARENQGRVPTDLIDCLFGGFGLRQELGELDRARYRAASSFAHNYCCSLLRRFLRRARMGGLLAELRHFYRLSQSGKIEHVRRAVYMV